MRLFGRSHAAPRRSGQRDLEHARVSLLSESDLFQDIEADQMGAIAERLPMATCRPGQLIYAPGETGEALFILKSGQVQLYRLAPDGRKLVLATLGPGTAFGEMSVIGQSMTGSFAEATSDCTLCVMSRIDIEQIVVEHPKVAVRLISMLSARLREVEDRLQHMAFASVPARTARLLLELRSGDEVVGFSHQDLAEILGTSRETVSRALVEFKNAGLVANDRRCIRILETGRLKRVAEGGG